MSLEQQDTENEFFNIKVLLAKKYRFLQKMKWKFSDQDRSNLNSFHNQYSASVEHSNGKLNTMATEYMRLKRLPQVYESIPRLNSYVSSISATFLPKDKKEIYLSTSETSIIKPHMSYGYSSGVLNCRMSVTISTVR